MKKRKRRPLTEKQKKLIQAIQKKPDSTLDELGRRAGYSKEARHNAWRALQSPAVRTRMAQIMENDPELRDSSLLKTLKEGLKAEDVRYVGMGARRVAEKDYAVRKEYLQLAFRLRGDLTPEEAAPVNNFLMKISMTGLARIAQGENPSSVLEDEKNKPS